MMKLPSGLAYQPSYAGVTLVPRSREGSSGSEPWGIWACETTSPFTRRTAASNDFNKRLSFASIDYQPRSFVPYLRVTDTQEISDPQRAFNRRCGVRTSTRF